MLCVKLDMCIDMQTSAGVINLVLRGPLSGQIFHPTTSTELTAFGSSDLIQDLSVTGQELRQVFDELLDALQSTLLHNGACLLCNRLWDRVSGQILQCCRQV